jgi:hypothetical protein
LIGKGRSWIEVFADSVILTESGGVAERLNAAVLKTAEPKGSVGSNPTPSASLKTSQIAYFEEFAPINNILREGPILAVFR